METVSSPTVGFSFVVPQTFKKRINDYAFFEEKMVEVIGTDAFTEYLSLNPNEIPAEDLQILTDIQAPGKDANGKPVPTGTVFFRASEDLHTNVHVYRAAKKIKLKDLGIIVLETYIRRHPNPKMA